MFNSYMLCRPIIALILVATCLSSGLVYSATAEIQTTSDYIAISVEAEDYEVSAFDGEDLRWTLTEPTTAQTSQDPDGNNSDGAVGQQYLELLPDVRVVHGDPFGPPTALWGDPGTGPELEYEIDFPEAGRYYVHVRLNSSGSEDNGIHVGLNDSWPPSGSRIQSCASGQGWTWTSRQRNSGGAGPCGANFTIWLDVEQPGVNTVKFSAREDGFELDRFVLIKDMTQNTRVCRPANEDQINCRDGSIETQDTITDISVLLEVDRTAGIEQDLFVFNAVIANDDGFDNANQVIMESNIDLGDVWEFVSSSDSCTISGQLLSCSLGNLVPTAPDEDMNIEFTLRAIAEGDRTVSVDVTTTSVDEDAANDASSLVISVEPRIEYATIDATTSQDISTPTVADETRLTVALKNTSDVAAEGVTVGFTVPTTLHFSDTDGLCTSEAIERLTCNIGSLDANEERAINVLLQLDSTGFYPVTIDIASDNLEEGSFSSTYIIEVVPVDHVVNEETESEVTEEGTEAIIEEIDEMIAEEGPETVVEVTESGADRDSPGDDNEGSISEEVKVAAQTSGGKPHWLLLALLSGFAYSRRRK